MEPRKSRLPGLFWKDSQPTNGDRWPAESASALPVRRLRGREGGDHAGGDLHVRVQGEGADESGAQVRAKHRQDAGVSGRNHCEAVLVGIRDFSNQPCGPCGRDTLHFAMKCRECGHVNETSAQAIGRSCRRHHARKRHGCADPRPLVEARNGLATARTADIKASKAFTDYGASAFRTRHERIKA